MNLRTIADGRVRMSMKIPTMRGSKKVNDDDDTLARRGKKKVGGGLLYIHGCPCACLFAQVSTGAFKGWDLHPRDRSLTCKTTPSQYRPAGSWEPQLMGPSTKAGTESLEVAEEIKYGDLNVDCEVVLTTKT